MPFPVAVVTSRRRRTKIIFVTFDSTRDAQDIVEVVTKLDKDLGSIFISLELYDSSPVPSFMLKKDHKGKVEK